MDWVYDKAFWFSCPGFAEEFIRGEAVKGFESPSEVIGAYKILQVVFKLLVAVAEAALNGTL